MTSNTRDYLIEIAIAVFFVGLIAGGLSAWAP